jgi:hypothetical protein
MLSLMSAQPASPAPNTNRAMLAAARHEGGEKAAGTIIWPS